MLYYCVKMPTEYNSFPRVSYHIIISTRTNIMYYTLITKEKLMCKYYSAYLHGDSMFFPVSMRLVTPGDSGE